MIKRSKREDSWRYYVLNMCKVFFAIHQCLSREFVVDIDEFFSDGRFRFFADKLICNNCSSFRDYYLDLGADLYYKDEKLISRCEAFRLGEVV